MTKWDVYYQKDLSSQRELIQTGTTTKVEFTPEKKGFYTIEADGKQAGQYEIKGWDGKFWKVDWKIWLFGGAVLFVFIIILKNKRSSLDDVTAYT